MKSTSAEGEFRSNKSTIPSGMSEDGSNPSIKALRNLAAFFFDFTFFNLTSHSAMRTWYRSGSIITFNDFKLPKEGRLYFNRLGVKERT